MAWTKDDLDQMNDVVYGAITKFYQRVIAPKMATKDDLKSLASKEDLAKVEDNLGKRIDKISEVVIETKTNHERRIRKLEDEVGIEPVERLTV